MNSTRAVLMHGVMTKICGFLLLIAFLGSSAYAEQFSADTTRAYAWAKSGQAALKSSNFASAQDYFEKAAEAYRSLEIWDRYIRCLNRLSTCHWRMGQLPQGKAAARKALGLSRDKLSPDHFEESQALLNLGVCHDIGGAYDSAIYYLEACRAIREKILDPDHPRLADVINNLGVVHESLGLYDEALELYFTSLGMRQRRYDKPHPDLGISYNNIGVIYDYMGAYDEALDYYGRSLSIHEELFGDNHPGTSYNCNNMAIIYRIQGSYQRAIEYFNRALAIQEKIFGEKHWRVAESYQNLGEVYNDMEEYATAMRYYRKSLEIRQEVVGQQHPHMADGYQHIGTVYLNQGDLASAREYFNRSRGIYTAVYGDIHPRSAASIQSIGMTYYEEGDYENADQHLLQALEIRKQIYPEKNPDIAQTLRYRGMVLLRQERTGEALAALQAALGANVPAYSDTSMWSTPPLQGYLSADELLETLELKAQALRKLDAAGQSKGAIHALKHYELCDTLIREIQKTYLNNEDKIMVARESADIYREAIDVCLTLYRQFEDRKYLERALYFSQANKMGVLRQQLADASAKKVGGIPDSLLLMERGLNVQRAYLQTQLSQTGADPVAYDEGGVTSLKQRLYGLNRQYDSLITAFEEQYPSYYQLKYADTFVDVETIQSLIPDEQTTIIDYFVSDSSMVAFVLDRDDIMVVESVFTDRMDCLIYDFRTALDPLNLMEDPGKNQAELLRVSGQLHQNLLAPVLAVVPKPIDRLIIIPHGMLAYVPFENLPSRPVADDDTDRTNYPYLIREYSISYAFSVFTWAQSDPQKHPWKEEFAGFAPDYGGALLASVRGLASLENQRERMGDLQYTSEEVASAARYFRRGHTFTGASATEQLFKQEAGNYRVLHLAMHAVADASNPMESKLIFAGATDSVDDGFLNAYELYNMNLHADLAVLSACNTGFGILKKGEGVMSLSRAFSYAGCSNLVMSLWKTDDRSTAEIMASFYAHLDAGHTIDGALRQAKLDYLNTADPLRAHPYFWAAFVANGPMEAIRTPVNYFNIFLWFAAIFAAIISWVLLRRRYGRQGRSAEGK